MRPSSKNNEMIIFARWARDIKRSDLQNLLSKVAHPQIISLALGLPDSDLFPTAAIAKACECVLQSERDALQYAPPLESLKQKITALMARRGVVCTPSQIFLTSGAQQGISLLSRLLLDTCDPVYLEEFSYPGFTQAISPFQPKLITIKSDPTDGIDLEDLESKLRVGLRPAFLYTIPEGHNPQGSSMAENKRYRLLDIAARWGFPIIEDDAYGFLQYAETQRIPLRGIDSKNVLYVGSFSKILAPSLRVGWLVVPEYMIQPLSVIKESTDIEICTFTQRLVDAYLAKNDLGLHIEHVRSVYKTKRDGMVSALREIMGNEVTYCIPQAGLFIWASIEIPFGTTALLHSSLSSNRVSFLPGEAFSVARHSGSNYLRLNFSHPKLREIPEGIRRLARAIADQRSAI
jgi:2-aminoadipate transaminase